MIERERTRDQAFEEYAKERAQVDAIVQSTIASNVSNKFYDVYDFLKNDIIQHVCEDTFKKVNDIKEFLKNSNKNISDSISNSKIKESLGIDIENLTKETNHGKTIEELETIGEKNKNRMMWFNLPYSVDSTDSSQKELIEMLQLVFEK